MTDKEKYDFIDHVVHLTLFVEDELLNEHGGEYSGLEEDGIDSNEYYRIITERVINILKKNNNYMQEEPVSIWHDANVEQPEEYRTVVVWNPTTMNGDVLTRCAEVYKGGIWAYIDDILKLSNVQRTVKDCKEEPVSEELEEAMKHNAPNNIGIDDLLYWRNGFITGVNWKEEQFEKNRLAACDRQTEKEAEIERDFVTSIIEKEHRQPTFDDAIKYGMRLKEKEITEALLSEVLPCFMHGGEADEVVAKLDEVLNKKK